MAFMSNEVGRDFEDFVAEEQYSAGRGSGYSHGATPDGRTSSGRRRRPGRNQQRSKSTAPSKATCGKMREAVAKEDNTAVENLLAEGFPVDHDLGSGWSALMLAASAAAVSMVDLLIRHSANVNFVHDMLSVLMAACSSRSNSEESLLQCVRLLVGGKAQVNARDRYGMTPLMFAAQKGRKSVVQFLLESKGCHEIGCTRLWTALCYAANGGHMGCVRVLVQAKADLTHRCNDGQTAEDLAFGEGHTAVAMYLKRMLARSKVKEEQLLEDRDEDAPEVAVYGEVELFLQGIQQDRYIATFKKHKVTLQQLLHMNDDDLKKMGIVNDVARATILQDAARVLQGVKHTTEEEPLRRTFHRQLGPVDMVKMLTNMERHVAYLSTTTQYILTQLKANRILSEDEEVEAAHLLNVCSETHEAAGRLLQNTEQLTGRLRKRVQGQDSNAEDITDVLPALPKQKYPFRFIKLLPALALTVGSFFLLQRLSQSQH